MGYATGQDAFWGILKSYPTLRKGGGKRSMANAFKQFSIEKHHNAEVRYNGAVSFRTPERTTSVIPHIISTVPHQISPAKVTADLDILARDALLKWLGLGKRQKVHTSRVHLLVVWWGWRTHPVVAKVDSKLILDQFWDCILKQTGW